MSSLQYDWHKIADVKEEISFASNGIAVVEAAGKKFCVSELEGALYAFAFKCPHASGFLAEGWLDPLGNLVCPVHRYKYNIKNGRNVTGEGYYLPTYPIEIRTEGVFVGFKRGGFFNFR